MAEKVDVIVVGAGLAGSSTAMKLAESDVNVMLVERASRPGEKNVSGGLLFSEILTSLVPNFWEDAPIERIITGYRISVLDKGRSTTIDFREPRYAKPPYNGFSVTRGKFDYWLAKRAEEAGALLATGVRVDGPLIEDGKVTGIVSGDETVRADIVIAADGVNSKMAIGAGLRNDYRPHEVALGVKEVIGLPRDVIEDRFSLSDNEGIAHLFLGATRGNLGGGFLYTNTESISLGSVFHLSSFENPGTMARDTVDYLKASPLVRRLVRDGALLEYSAHLVPESGHSGLARLYRDGMLVAGDAAGFVLNLGFSIEGMNYAIASGIAAADTTLRAVKHKDFSTKRLSYYETALDQYGVLKNLKTFKRFPKLLGISRVHHEYPALINTILTDLFTSSMDARSRILPLVMKRVLSSISVSHLLRDVIQVVRAL